MPKGKFIIISGPSGSGKTTLVDELLKVIPNSTRVVTLTTRPARPHEKEGVDWHFVSREEFEDGIRRGDFLEYSEHFGSYYGASRSRVEAALAKYDYVFGVLDVHGTSQVKRAMPECVTIFLEPDSMDSLRRRLIAREGGETEAVRVRLARADLEMAAASSYDYRVMSLDGRVKETVEATRKIIEGLG